MAYVAIGKEILDGNRHIADCCDEATAVMIVEALAIRDELGEWRPVMESPEWPISVPPYYDEQSEFPLEDDTPVSSDKPHQVRQEGDEWACSCGARWDVAEGDNHP